MSMIAVMALSSATTVAMANENDKASLLSADQTQAKSERKVVLGISRLGLEANQFTFPVYYTPAGKNAKTRHIADWTVNLSQDFADAVLADNYPFLIPNRYDKLVYSANQAMILTATKDVKVAISNMKAFSPSLSSYKDFETSEINYLNDEIAQKIAPVLSAAKDARYSEMSGKEAATFITTKAKEVGMPAAVLESLVNSAYAFSVYMPKLTGSISIHQNIYTDSKGRTHTSYSTSLNAPITLDLTVNKMNGTKFAITSEVTSEAGGNTNLLAGLFEGLAKSISGSSGVSTSYMPNESHAQALFNQAFKDSFKDNILALSTKIKHDRNFAITAPVTEVDGSTAKLNVGVQEDIRVDHPFRIVRTEDGQENTMGYMKVRTAGDNCLLLPKEKRTQTVGSMIYGSTEEADLAIEHPWTGVFGTLEIESDQGTFLNDKSGSDKDTGTGASNMLALGFNADLGYVMNNPVLSEVWMNMSFGFGTATYDKLPTYSTWWETFTPSGDSALAMKFKMGLEKRFYIASGLYLSGAMDLDYEMQGYSYTSSYSTDNDGTLSLGILSVTPEARVGYMINPNLDFYGTLGYNVPVSTSASFAYGKDSTELALTDTYSRQSAIDVKVGVNVHLNFAGPFAKMFKKPSQRCEALKH